MQKYRILVDLMDNTIRSEARQVVELSLGDPFFREANGSLVPLRNSQFFSGQRFVWTGLHDELAEARHEAAAELSRRAEQMMRLSHQCKNLQEITNG